MIQIIELKKENILKAYDGYYLSNNFGYSCANFNVDFSTNMDIKMFDIYIKNPNNISCFVAIKHNKICGRRMFFKGKSLMNDEYFDVLPKKGEEICYLYGYYGEGEEDIYYDLTTNILTRNRNKIIYSDDFVFSSGKISYKNDKKFIIQIERTNFSKYPPIDFLYVCPELKAFSNFRPDDFMIEILEDDYKIKNINFYQAYRFDYNRRNFDIFNNVSTWKGFKKNKKS